MYLIKQPFPFSLRGFSIMIKIRNALFIASMFLSNFVYADIIDTVDLNSSVYGAFNNTIDETTANNTAAFFVGEGSGYHIDDNIVFTNASGIIVNVLSTNGTDEYYWSWTQQQNNLIGTAAVASSTTQIALLNNGVLTSYLGDIQSVNGESPAFCCTANTAVLNIATGHSTVPEPGTLLLIGLGLLGFVRRFKNHS
jgi:hypothetical protein